VTELRLMNFGDALRQVKDGCHVAREIWATWPAWDSSYLTLHRPRETDLDDQLLVAVPDEGRIFPFPGASSCLLAQDWVVLGEGYSRQPQADTDFGFALSHLREGHRVRRRFWADPLQGAAGDCMYLHVFESPLLAPQLMCLNADEMRHPFSGSQPDLLAGDWELAD
jgi:hypothetical protein